MEEKFYLEFINFNVNYYYLERYFKHQPTYGFLESFKT